MSEHRQVKQGLMRTEIGMCHQCEEGLDCQCPCVECKTVAAFRGGNYAQIVAAIDALVKQRVVDYPR